MTSIAGFYPLFALLRGELLSGKHHTSLLDGIRFQLSRVGGGSVFDSHSPTRHLLQTWLHLDTVMLACAVAVIVPLLAVRRLRWIGLALAVPIVMALRPGSYVPAMYVIALLPFVALGSLHSPPKRPLQVAASIIRLFCARHWPRRRSPCSLSLRESRPLRGFLPTSR